MHWTLLLKHASKILNQRKIEQKVQRVYYSVFKNVNQLNCLLVAFIIIKQRLSWLPKKNNFPVLSWALILCRAKHLDFCEKCSYTQLAASVSLKTWKEISPLLFQIHASLESNSPNWLLENWFLSFFDPLGRLTVPTGSDHSFFTLYFRPYVCLFVRNFQNKTNFKRKQCLLLVRRWVWPSGSFLSFPQIFWNFPFLIRSSFPLLTMLAGLLG